MEYRTICISGTDGSEMRLVAAEVAERLGLRVVDEEIVMRAAAESGVGAEIVADVERRRTFLDRALGAFVVSDPAAFAGGMAYAGDGRLDDDLRDLIRAAIEETADRGGAVIVAHAASHALAARPDVLRVLVTAPVDVRRARLAAEEGLDEKAATKAIDQADGARADYLRRFYGERRESPEQYDLVLSTGRLTASDAAAIVGHAARG